jgi:hypothetical protein
MDPPSLLVPACLRWATAPIVAHGLTDLCSVEALPVYVIGMFAPGADAMALAAFASVVHFARDFGGTAPSLAAHATWATLACVGRVRLATVTLYTYMGLVHVPRHVDAHPPRARALAFGTGVVGALAWRPAVVPLAPLARRLVVSHVAHEWLHSQRAPRRLRRAHEAHAPVSKGARAPP